MSLLRLPKFQRIGNSWESIVDFFSGRSRKRAKGSLKNRSLKFDPLEERMLLTISATNVDDQLVNQTSGTQTTGATSYYNTGYYSNSQAVACDNNGDFVVVWTRYDQVLDPELGTTVSDANIYARYFTDEVQRLVLPEGTTRFSLIYGGGSKEVQKITFGSFDAADTIQGVFKLGFDLNQDGYVDPTTEVTKAINFDETLDNSAVMQNALSALGGSLADVKVTMSTSRQYLVEFSDPLQQQSSWPLLQVLDPAWTSGTMPGTYVSEVQHSEDIGLINNAPRILVSSTTPSKTATSIKSAFDTMLGTDASGNSYVKVNSVSTTSDPNGLWTFDITFVGNMGKTDQPQLLFGQMWDSSGAALSVQDIAALNTGNITTLKEPSPEFRVNPVEEDDPYTIGLDLYNQTNPAIAMDADGDYVITWQSEVSEDDNPGSVSDIYARRFSPSALMDIPNLVISTNKVSVVEGDTSYITVKLARAPTSNITVNIAKQSGDSDLTISPAKLTFTPSNWNTEQTVTISAAVDSDNTNGTAYFDVSISGYVTQTITATEIDAKSIVVSTNTLSVPEGGKSTYTVMLGAAPAVGTTVTVNFTKLTGGDADISFDADDATSGNQTSLTFDSTNWNVPRTVTVIAKEDSDLTDGTATIRASATGYGSQSVAVSEAENDSPYVILSTNELSVVEEYTSTFTVSLSAAPTGTVTIGFIKLTGGDPDITLPDYNTTQTGIQTFVTFNAANYNIPQTITVSAARDSDASNGTAYYYVGEYAYSASATSPADLLVNDSVYPVQMLTIHEIDVPKLVVTGTNLIVNESQSGTTNGYTEFTIALANAPIYDNNGDGIADTVTVTIIQQTGDTDLVVDTDLNTAGNQTTLTFNSGNWDAPQTVRVIANYDADTINGTRTFLIYAPGYATAAVTTAENDLYHAAIAGLVISSVNVPVIEGADTTITVALASAPTVDADADGTIDDVVITITPAPLGDADLTADSETLTFSPDPASDDYWGTPHPLTISAADDADNTNGTRAFTLTSTQPTTYGPATINASEIDAMSIIVSTNAVSVLEGTSNTFTVRLPVEIDNNVTVTIRQGGGDTDLTLNSNPITLTFTPDNWDVDQTVTINAALDADSVNGTRTFIVSATGRPNQTITATEIDTPLLTVSPQATKIIEGGSGTVTLTIPTGATLNINTQMGGDSRLSYTRTPVTSSTVTVKAANNTAYDGNGTSDYVVTAAGYAVTAFYATVIDDETSPVVISSDPVSVDEGGYTPFDVKLSYQPISDVTVTVARVALVSDTDLAFFDPTTGTYIDTATLTFTSSNWSVPQKLLFYAAQDADKANGTAYFHVTAKMGTTTFLQDSYITVNEVDDDYDPLVISSDYLQVQEGSSICFTVALPSAPTIDADGDGVPDDVQVVIARQAGSDTDIYAIPTILTFTADNWDQWQTVKILANSDGDTVDGTATFLISATGYKSRTLTVSEIDYTQGARALGGAFLVNTFTTNAQVQPSIGMDRDGNFVISWTNVGQSVSYFNGITAQRYNRDGDRLGSEIQVSDEETGTERDSFVSLSADGHILITWVEGRDCPWVMAKVYDANGTALYDSDGDGLGDQFFIERGCNPTAAWDLNNNFVIAFDVMDWDTDAQDHNLDIEVLSLDRNAYPYLTDGVYMIRFGLGATGAAAPTILVTGSDDGIVRVNSGETEDPLTTATAWSYFQGNNQVVIDADGDITVTYDGFSGYYKSDASYSSIVSYGDYYTYYLNYYQNYNLNSGANYTDEQLGNLWAQFQALYSSYYSLDPNGIMYSQFDTDPSLSNNVYSIDGLYSDVSVNTQSDGQDQTYYITLDERAVSGGFTLSISNPYDSDNTAVNVVITPTYTSRTLDGPNIDADRTLTAIENALNNRNALQTVLGNFDAYGEYVMVDYFTNASNQIVYEIIFVGTSHNVAITMSLPQGGNAMRRLDPTDTTQTIAADNPQVTLHTTANLGTMQQYASVAMQSSGSFVVAWTQYSIDTSTTGSSRDMQDDLLYDTSDQVNGGIYFRTFTETTDTAGPQATDFILTDGTRLKDNAQVTQTMQYLVVSFDEQMMTTGTGSVTNTSNWALIKDGVQIKSGIYKIYYGLNKAYELGLSSVAANKYEAVLVLDGNGISSGITSLANGHYQIVAFNSMHDVAGNPLGRTGYNVNGANFSRSFDVAALTGTETLVNLTTAGSQATSPGQKAVASDGNGDYVVVWTSTDASGYESVYAKLYTTAWTLSGTTRVSTITAVAVINPSTGLPWTNDEILVAANIYQFPSGESTGGASLAVAMDGDGDFVVTWTKMNSGDANWDVYARMYDAVGTPKGPSNSEFLVNTYTDDIQNHPSVAIDADGDFVVAWQSLGEDGSGYGVYAQRYSPAGEELNGTNETQLITLVGRPQGYFYLSWNGTTSATKITLPSDPNNLVTQDLLDQIAAVLTALGAEVTVTAVTSTDIQVAFLNSDGSMDVPQITVSGYSLTGDPGVRINIITQVDGASGEIQINDTTANDQMDPSVAMSEQGEFVITWTGYGQDDDSAWQSNIYAKQFSSNDSYRSTQSYSYSDSDSTDSDSSGVPFITTTDSPANHVVQAGTGYDGVVEILVDMGPLGTAGGTGTLLVDRRHILTAAHVVSDQFGQLAGTVSVIFTLASGNVTIDAKQVIINPNYTGDPFTSPDLAIIELAQAAPTGVTGFDIYRGTDEVGQIMEFYGYGISGTGLTGGGNDFGVKRQGENKWESYGNLIDPTFSANLLAYDFDDGTATRDAFGVDHGINDLGLGDQEACQAHGDSGGPSFINGRIAGVCTGGYDSTVYLGTVSGYSYFGEFGLDTRVSVYADWIDSVAGGGSGPEFIVNQTTAGVQQWSSVALDANGDFVVSWTSYGQDGTGSGYGAGVSGLNGVYARRFSSDGTAQSDDFKVNTFSANNQQHSQASMNAAGDFAIVWESYQDRPAASSLPDSPNSYGIYTQRYARTSLIGVDTTLGPNGEIGSEFRLNSTTDGDQRYPSVALNANGDLVAVWSGNGKDAASGTTDSQGVFYQRYEQKSDTAGPFVTDVLDDTTSTPSVIYNNALLTTSVTKFVIDFDENLSTVGGAGGLHSVLNLNNWTISQNGSTLVNGIASVEFTGLRNSITGKYQAVVTFDSSITQSGNQALGQGTYVLTISDNVQDIFGNALDGNLDGANGGAYNFNFTIDILGQGGTIDDPIGNVTSVGTTSQNNGRTYPETPGAVAVDADGDHVVVWTAYDSVLKHDRVYYQIFKADGTAADLPLVDAGGNYLGSVISNAAPVLAIDTTNTGDTQRFASVACDADGDFVVTWTEYDSATGDADIYARRFNALGLLKGVYYNAGTGNYQPYFDTAAAAEYGDTFRVNTYTAGAQKWSNVAMDTLGDFVITWSSYGQENNGTPGTGYGVYVAKYNSYGQIEIPQFQVNCITSGNQYHSSAALMDDGWFIITFEGSNLETTNHDIFVRLFNPAGTVTLTEQYVTDNADTDYRYPDIAATPNGNVVVVTYQALDNTGNGWDIKANLLTIDKTGETSGLGLAGVYPGTTEISVNTTVTGNQQYPSVAVDYNGGFTIAWSGFGNRSGQSDLSGDGVFYQRFNSSGTRVGGETRANVATAGNQRIASVGSDAVGNVVIAFTGVGSTATTTTIYKTVTAASSPRTDSVGPTITDVLLPDRTRLMDNDSIDSSVSITQLIVVFDENMYLGTGTSGLDSIINLSNWALFRNGSEIIGAVTNVVFAYNSQTHKYEATVYLSGSGISGGASALISGEYQLLLKGNVVDNSAVQNAMYTTAFVAAGQNYSRLFLIGSAQSGTEFRVNGVDESGNSDVKYTQVTGSTDLGDYNNTPGTQNGSSLAIDHKGDFVTVWTSYGQDDPGDVNGKGVYMRLYDSNNNPLTRDVLVNTYTIGDQCNPSVAMDAVGNFVITWTSEGQDADGTWGIYAQRFNSLGQKVGGEFQVNTSYIGDQVNPSVALNSYGNFVIAWASLGENFGYYNDIHAQIYNYDGQKVGSEFRVNSQNLPGDVDAPGGSNEANPDVAMDDSGNFIVIWEQITWNNEGLLYDTYLVGRMFDALGNARVHPAAGSQQGNDNLEFRIDASSQQLTGGQYPNFLSDGNHVRHQQPCDDTGVYTPTEYNKTARNASIVMDSSGNFVVVWESFEDNDVSPAQDVDYPGRQRQDSADSYGIYFRRFAADGTPLTTGDHNANLVMTVTGTDDITQAYAYTSGDQVNASIALDENGQISIVWSGNGATFGTRINDPTQHDTSGVFVRDFASSTFTGGTIVESAPKDVETTVNTTVSGTQTYPSIAMTPSGSYVIVWSGSGTGDSSGIFARRFNSATDTVGPMAVQFLLSDGSRINSNNQVSAPVSSIKVVFDEAMMTTGTNSVTNTANYQLLKDGIVVQGAISGVTYALDPGTNQYIATINLSSTLTDGRYQLVVLNSVRDKTGNPLQSSGTDSNGSVASQVMNITVASGSETQVNSAGLTANATSPNATTVASNSNGDQVVVWVSATPGKVGVYAKLYQMTWTNTASGRQSTGLVARSVVNPATGLAWANNEICISGNSTATDASVAMDTDGDFVVTFSVYNSSTNYDVYVQRFSATGQPLDSTPFKVNTYTAGAQRYANVAMDSAGDFVVTWQSLQTGDTSINGDGSGYGIYAQRYNAAGDLLGGANEIQTISFINSWTGTFRLAWDNDNNTATADLVTAPITYSGNATQTAYAIQDALEALGAEVDVLPASSKISIRFTGDSGAKNQVLLKATNQVKSGGASGASIAVITNQEGATGEFRVNDTTTGNQTHPSIGMDEEGNFVISWTSEGQDGDSAANTNIYAKRFASSGYYLDPNGYEVTSASSSDSDPVSGLEVESLMTTVDDPDNHVVSAATGYDGVVRIMQVSTGGYGSGVLLAGTNFILTAAHVVCEENTNIPLAAGDMTVIFDLSTGPVYVGVSQIFVNAGWTGSLYDGNDVALILLSGMAPTGVAGYSIYRGSDEVGQIADFYGYGTTGTGLTGDTQANGDYNDAGNVKRHGRNVIDATSAILGMGNTYLILDFDDGTAKHDALGVLFGIHNLDSTLVATNQEACTAPGDSGGPMFINGQIAGICSFGGTLPGTQDVLAGINSSYGELFGETRVSLFADWIDTITNYSGAEFLVNENTATVNNTSNNQMWSSVAMDADGDFVITWTSTGHDGVGTGYGSSTTGNNGVFARRFNAQATALAAGGVTYAAGNVFQVNTYALGDQQYSHVAVDADGDFVITWESCQSSSSSTIQAKRFVRAALLAADTSGTYGANGEIGSEITINSTASGAERYPGVAIDDTGDFVVVWSDGNNVYQRLYQRPKDDAGPIVGSVLNAVSATQFTNVADSTVLGTYPTKFVVTFGEDLSILGGASGITSILNVNNWALTHNGVVIPDGVVKVEYGLNQAYKSGVMAKADGKYEAVVYFDADPDTSGNQALGLGDYTLTIEDSVQDLFGNKLDGDYTGSTGGEFIRSFSVISDLPYPGVQITPDLPVTLTTPGTPASDTTWQDIALNTEIINPQDSQPVVASDANGNYVVVWTTTENDTGDIYAQRFDRYGRTLGRVFLVSSYQATRNFTLDSSTSAGTQSNPDVAMDPYGNFVVTWTGQGQGDDVGVYARVFDSYGNALGDEFLVNQTTPNTQSESRAAMDANGNFVVTWTSGGDIYARCYNILGTAQTNEFAVNTAGGAQSGSDVAMADNGNFVVVWQSDQQDGSSSGIYGRVFNFAGNALTGEIQINTYTNDKQLDPCVAMDSQGNFIVAWSSFGQDGSGYGVYARRFNAAGGARDANEFLVNAITTNWQYQPDVSADSAGNFVITWSAYGQVKDSNNNPLGYDIFARKYNADGTTAIAEFRINVTAAGDQLNSAVAMDSDGDFTVAWTGPSGTGTGVYCRVVAVNAGSYVPVTSAGNGWITGTTDDPAPTDTSPTTGTQTFAVTGPASGTYAVGDSMTINWTAANVTSNDVISLCLDKDTTFWNGNEKWIEVDKVTAVDGNGSYTFNVPTSLTAGSYYVAGYMYDKSSYVFTYSHASSPVTITVPAPATQTFAVTGPTSGTYAVGDSMTVNWTAANVPSNGVISLCLDKDTTFWNGNEKWVEVDKVAAANGNGSYTFSVPTSLAAGSYYVGGYMYDKGTYIFTYSHASSPVAITVPTTAPATQTFAVTGPASGTYAVGDSMTVNWTAANVPSNGVISLCLDKDTTFWNGNEKWVEVDKVAAANGNGSYTFSVPTSLAAGSYYVGGYMYDKGTYIFTYSHASSPVAVTVPTITTATQTFAVTGPTSGTYAVGDSMTVNWTAANVPSNGVISLCLDKDTTFWNGNEKWIEVDKVAAANGNGSYTFNVPSGLTAGSYYVGGYMYDKGTYIFTYSHASSPVAITVPAPATQTFTMTSPTSGSYAPGDSVTITWTAANVTSNDVITLCLDKDNTFWNGNEKWIEVDKVAAANGNGSYTFTMPNMASGTYYVAGYMYNKATYNFTYSSLTSPITVPAQTFAVTGPASGTYAPGNSVTVTWTAANVTSNDVISLCLDKDTTFWNGNEKWIEVDKVAAANGSGSYTFNVPSSLAAGSYYVGGYMYDKGTYLFTYSHVTQSISLSSSMVGSSLVRAGTDGASLALKSSNSAFITTDRVFSSNAASASNASQLINNQNHSKDDDDLLSMNDRNEELSAVDAALQDQDLWLEKASADWLV